MTRTELSPAYSVGPQITPADISELKAAGVTDIVDMRPDAEIGAGPLSGDLAAAASALGLRFHYRPVTPGHFEAQDIAYLETLLDDPQRRVFGYCRSGMRAASVWALAVAAEKSPDDILGCCVRAGYDVGGLRPRLEATA